MSQDSHDYWNRVWKKLTEKNISLKELSEGTNVSYGVMRQYKTNNRLPKTDVQVKIASYLDTTVEYLITGKEVFNQDNEDFNYLFNALKNNPDLCRTIVALIKEIEKNEKK